MFGNPPTGSGGGSLFGGKGGNTTAQPNIFGNKPPGNLFGGGAAPSSGGLFGGSAGGSAPASGSLFGGGSTNPTAPTTNTFGASSAPAATAPTSLFGNTNPTNPAAASTSIFGAANTTTSAAPSSLFGGGGTTTSAPASTSSGTTPSNPLFGGSPFAKPAEQNATASPKPTGSSFFSQPPSTLGATPAAAPATGGSLFGQPPKPADTTAPATSTAPSGGIFGGGLGLFGKPPAAPTPSASTPAPAGGLFGSLAPAEKKDGATPAAAAPTLNLFGGAKPAEKKDTPAAPAPFSLGSLASKDATKPAEATTALGAPAATSITTSAVAVPPPSMLRGKTIEEIVNRWTTELETHVREFNRFAGEVAVWDRALIENGNNLSTLYSHVLAAEREQNDIDQSLDHIEQQQKELASTLDAYEKVTQEILGSQGGGLRALDTGPADTERDKNYMLATDLHTHLDDLSGSLTQMIESVNALSLPSNDSGPVDDPMAQIAQILSSHLESLQWIDGAVREVDSKVSDVERRVKESGGSTSGQRGRSFGLNR
ncbi:Nucleoporin NSP1 [Hypsizygus marmoreus]|uniref:Nucleoporin NSP1 n=1 Tax=Hypsizygus marmoreus TaxID=39966 RepID=A0A369JND3_HYPMA|nr:Nucleoporin NSP1 [Hypsizygus marmoreus]